MTPAYTAKQGHVRYRYYVCARAQKRGWHTCPSKALPAGAIEGFVIEQLQALALDRKRLRDTVIDACARVAQRHGTWDAQEEHEAERDTALACAALLPGPDTLTPPERARLVRRLVERVDYDGAAGTVAIRLQPAGLQAVALEQRSPNPEDPHEPAVDP